MLLWHKHECCCAFTWVDKWLVLFSCPWFLFPGARVVVVCSLCELSLYVGSNELLNYILYAKIWGVEKGYSRQFLGKQKKNITASVIFGDVCSIPIRLAGWPIMLLLQNKNWSAHSDTLHGSSFHLLVSQEESVLWWLCLLPEILQYNLFKIPDTWTLSILLINLAMVEWMFTSLYILGSWELITGSVSEI